VRAVKSYLLLVQVGQKITFTKLTKSNDKMMSSLEKIKGKFKRDKISKIPPNLDTLFHLTKNQFSIFVKTKRKF